MTIRSTKRGGVFLGIALALIGVSGALAAKPARTVINTPSYPIFALSGYGSIWVGTHHSTLLYRIDPRTNRIAKRIVLHQTPCGTPVLGRNAVLVPDCQDEGGNTLAISPATNRVVRTFHASLGAYGYGSYWGLTLNAKFVKRLDPQTGVTLASIPSGISDSGADYACVGTAGAGSIWFGADADKTVSRIDAATNKVVAVIALPGAAAQPSPGQGYAGGCPMIYAAGKVWRANPAGIYEIDPATNTARLLRVHIGNLDMWGDMMWASGGGSLWVRTAGSTVTRIDPKTGNVLGSYPATGGGGGVTVAYGSLWVANAGADTVWREPLVTRRVAGARADTGQLRMTAIRSTAMPIDGPPLQSGFGALWSASSRGLLRIMPGTEKSQILLHGSIDDVAIAGHSVFALSRSRGTLYRVDPDSLRTTRRWRLRADPHSLVATPSAVFVDFTSASSQVARIDLESGRTRYSPLPAGTGPSQDQSIAVGSGSVWELSEGSLYRLDPVRLVV